MTVLVGVLLSIAHANLRSEAQLHHTKHHSHGHHGKKHTKPVAKAHHHEDGKKHTKTKHHDSHGKKLHPAAQHDAVLDAKEAWLSCSYDWDHNEDQKVADQKWDKSWNTTSELNYLRSIAGVEFVQYATRREVMSSSLSLLGAASTTLDSLGVNWYMSAGAEIGQLTSKFPVPWDDDIAVSVRMRDRQKLFDFVYQGDKLNGSTYEFEMRSSCGKRAARFDPHTPSAAILAFKPCGPHKEKVLWVDLPTGAVTDLCFDCGLDTDKYVHTQKAQFGGLKVNVPEKPFTKDVFTGRNLRHGVNLKKGTVSMSLTHANYKCQFYNCEGVEHTSKYVEIPTDFPQTFDFSRQHGGWHCAEARDTSSCTPMTSTLTNVDVQSCDRDPTWHATHQKKTSMVTREDTNLTYVNPITGKPEPAGTVSTAAKPGTAPLWALAKDPSRPPGFSADERLVEHGPGARPLAGVQPASGAASHEHAKAATKLAAKHAGKHGKHAGKHAAKHVVHEPVSIVAVPGAKPVAKISEEDSLEHSLMPDKIDYSEKPGYVIQYSHKSGAHP